MKRLVLATAAISLLAVPVAQAQSRGQFGAPDHRYEQPYVKKGHDLRRGHGGDYKVIRKKPRGHHWTRGQRVPDWQRRHVVRDWHRHGLRKPARGQHWVRVGNDYLLVGIATGLITGLMLGR